jgi:hypothetical protein
MRSESIDNIVVIRAGLYLPTILLGSATTIFLVGLLFFMPFMRGYNPPIGFAICGGAAALGIVGYLLLKNRRPQVNLTPNELQLPGFGIDGIPWRDVVRANVVEVRANGRVDYLGIDIADAARERVRQPSIIKVVGALAGAWCGEPHDLMLNCDALEWTSQQLADEINRRAANAAETTADSE